MEEIKEIIDNETEEDNNLKTYLDNTIPLEEVIKEVKENDHKWRKRIISYNPKKLLPNYQC